jgi:putative membrane protein
MRNFRLSVLAVVALFWGTGCSSTNTDTSNSTAENVAGADSASAAATDMATGATTTQPLDSTSFPIMAASSDMFEVLSSTEAQKRATHAEVKKFAEHMLTDHTKTSTELKSIAASKNILLPGAPLPLHQRLLAPLSTKTGKEFDEAYMKAQVAAHRTTVALFETAANSEADPELKAFAQKALPSLKMHLDMAKKTEGLVD